MNFLTKTMMTLMRLARVVGLATLLVAAPSAFAVDVNTATQEQLLTVRGIGPKTAQIIIEERGRGGRFQSLEDLSDRVKGIGPKKAAAMQAAGLTIEGTASTPAASAPVADKPQPGKRTR